MPRIDFYLLDAPEDGACDVTACRIAEKAWSRGHRVHLHVDSPESARRLDDLLWTWRDESFVPHRVCAGPGADCDAGAQDRPGDGETVGGAGDVPARTTVTIGWGALPRYGEDVLLNLGTRVPEGFERFARIAEFVGGADSARSAGRERFRRYREHGCELQTHRV